MLVSNTKVWTSWYTHRSYKLEMISHSTLPRFPTIGCTYLQDTTLPVARGPNRCQPVYVAKGKKFRHKFCKKSSRRCHQLLRPMLWNRPFQWNYMLFGGYKCACFEREEVLVGSIRCRSHCTGRCHLQSRDNSSRAEAIRMTAKNANGCKFILFRVQAYQKSFAAPLAY